MSLRLEMLQVARLATKLLGESSGLIVQFLQSQQDPNGGFKNRDGTTDLYYTAFGLEGFVALQRDPFIASLRTYLEQFGSGDRLDFVHLCCLARCWAGLGACGQDFPSPTRRAIARALNFYRTSDGGFHPMKGAATGTVYGCFLAVGAYQDIDEPLPSPLSVIQCLKYLETPDGAWSNERGMAKGSTNATAAAVGVLRNLGAPINSSVGGWLLARCHKQGGFVAAPNTPLPDLLSTATALHALAGLQIPLGSIKESCLDFVDSLWTNEGGFHGHWADDVLDCEYTYYGLLALGHLSL
jgi:prenyltransferase beta subunit